MMYRMLCSYINSKDDSRDAYDPRNVQSVDEWASYSLINAPIKCCNLGEILRPFILMRNLLQKSRDRVTY